jgi:hypothetical protein
MGVLVTRKSFEHQRGRVDPQLYPLLVEQITEAAVVRHLLTDSLVESCAICCRS